MVTGMCYPKYQILYVFKIKVVFTPSSYNVSASCIIIYNQTVCLFQYIQNENGIILDGSETPSFNAKSKTHKIYNDIPTFRSICNGIGSCSSHLS